MILDNTLYYEGLSESLGDLFNRTIDNDNEDTNDKN
jgi:hypothetical protein